MSFTIWDIVRNLLLAFRWTVVLSIIAFIGGMIVMLPLIIVRLRGKKWMRKIIDGYVGLFQGTPLLMQLFLSFFGLSMLGFNLGVWWSAGICLTLYSSAYFADIFSGSINAIPKGQWEASRCLGLGFISQLRFVIFPQAMRIATAPTVGLMVQIIKGTALTSIIGFVELTKMGQNINNATNRPFLVFFFVAVGYFILCYPLSCYSKYLERKYHATDNH